MYPNFKRDIKRFNEFYGVESNNTPTHLGYGRMQNFKAILLEELNEIDTIQENEVFDDEFVDMADLLGDIIVYAASEARRWGIDLEPVLEAIMESNFSKAGPDGKPIINEYGKIKKGPNFKPPEPAIRKALFGDV